MSAEKQLIPSQKQCPVCLMSYPLLYQISNCQHIFCQSCSISFIDAQADNFSSTKCLQQGCNKPLDHKKQIYNKLPQKTKLKIKKHDMFVFLQKNPQFKQCTQENCLGYFNKKSKQPKCNTCLKYHCNKCHKSIHIGQCKIQNDRQMIGNLNYKKCPECQVWIQKMNGCDYIDCKCGCKFCYRCGNRFDRDPCRYGEVWRRNTEIRKVLKSISVKKPQTAKCNIFVNSEYVFFVPKLILQAFFSVVFTMVYSSAIMCTFLILFCLTAIFAPLALFTLVCEVEGIKRYILITLMILLYPVMNAVFLIGMIILVLLYPCLRNTYHHGLYDPVDSGLSATSYVYMSVIEAIWSF